jgi:hypothetical protein
VSFRNNGMLNTVSDFNIKNDYREIIIYYY